jgi:hypothetical protein
MRPKSVCVFALRFALSSISILPVLLELPCNLAECDSRWRKGGTTISYEPTGLPLYFSKTTFVA